VGEKDSLIDCIVQKEFPDIAVARQLGLVDVQCTVSFKRMTMFILTVAALYSCTPCTLCDEVRTRLTATYEMAPLGRQRGRQACPSVTQAGGDPNDAVSTGRVDVKRNISLAPKE